LPDCATPPRRAVDHHRPPAGAAREGGTNRGRGAGADVVGLISERARQRADLERHLHRVVDRNLFGSLAEYERALITSGSMRAWRRRAVAAARRETAGD